MTAFVLVVLIAVFVVLLWNYLFEQVHGKGKVRTEIADGLTTLLRLMENGGKLIAEVVDSRVSLVFERSSGDDDRAVVALSLVGESDSVSIQDLVDLGRTVGFADRHHSFPPRTGTSLGR